MIDGGLVNPVPVSACRAMKADIVIAVNINSGLLRAQYQTDRAKIKEAAAEDSESESMEDKREFNFFKKLTRDNDNPGVLDIVHSSIQIMQERILRSRLAGDPPDLLLSPRVGDIGLMEFHRAREAIAEGRRCVERSAQSIRDVIDLYA